MFSPFRLITLGLLAFGVYMGFFAAPAGKPEPTSFDPALVAEYEVGLWQAARVREEVGSFTNAVLLQRELNRYTWFRALQTGWPASRATSTFYHLTHRYERVLPDLEEIAAVEKVWRNGNFDTAVVARTQLNWLVTGRMPNLGDSNEVASMMAEEYGLRYGLRPDQMFSAAALRAEAYKMSILPSVDPDWPTITKLLADSYSALRTALEDSRRSR